MAPRRARPIPAACGSKLRPTLRGSASKVSYKPLPVDDPRVRQPDITKARKLLGWEPRVAFEDGLARTIADIKRRLEARG